MDSGGGGDLDGDASAARGAGALVAPSGLRLSGRRFVGGSGRRDHPWPDPAHPNCRRSGGRFQQSTPTSLERDGLFIAFGIGEAPIGVQGTFSLWRDSAALTRFAYHGEPHRTVIGQAGQRGLVRRSVVRAVRRARHGWDDRWWRSLGGCPMTASRDDKRQSVRAARRSTYGMCTSANGRGPNCQPG